MLARRHETLAVRLVDPRENELPDVGPLILTDSETGEQLWVNTHDGGFRPRLTAAARRGEQHRADAFPKAGVDVLVLRTDEDLVRSTVRFAYARRQRAARRGAARANA